MLPAVMTVDAAAMMAEGSNLIKEANQLFARSFVVEFQVGNRVAKAFKCAFECSNRPGCVGAVAGGVVIVGKRQIPFEVIKLSKTPRISDCPTTGG